MDSRDSPPRPLPAPANMAGSGKIAYSTSMSNASINAASTMVLNPLPTQMLPPSAVYPFNSMIAPAPLPLDAINAAPNAGSHAESLNVDSGKKKRGRPRKYAPEGSTGLRLGPTTAAASSGDHGDLGATPDSEKPAKKPRGRPVGSGNKKNSAHGSAGLTLHSVLAKPGEDVAAKVVSFSQQGPRAIVIISANGTIQSATLQHAERTGGLVTVAYEGPYEMICMSGSYVLSETDGTPSRTGGLSVLLAGPGGRVFGGAVAGMLMAGSQVQVIIGSFLAENKKLSTSMVNSGSEMNNFSSAAAARAAAPSSSLGASSGESSAADNGGGNPLNTRQPGMVSNSSGQPMHNAPQMGMYYKVWEPRS